MSRVHKYTLCAINEWQGFYFGRHAYGIRFKHRFTAENDAQAVEMAPQISRFAHRDVKLLDYWLDRGYNVVQIRRGWVSPRGIVAIFTPAKYNPLGPKLKTHAQAQVVIDREADEELRKKEEVHVSWSKVVGTGVYVARASGRYVVRVR